MKNRIALSIIVLFILSACSTSTQMDNPQRIGTWDIVSSEQAKWNPNPVGNKGAYKVAFAKNDTTSPDTTYFYDNGVIQAEIQEVSRKVFEGDFEFKIKDNSLDVDKIDSLNFHGIVVENLGEAFQVVGYRGTQYNLDHVIFKIQTNFKCSINNNSTQDLRLAFLEFQLDTVSTPPDTLFYYQMDTNGLYSTASYIACSN